MTDYKFSVYIDRADEYRYRLKAGNGEIVLTGEGYVVKQGCLRGIASVKVNAPYDTRYVKKINSSGQYFFVLKAGNGETIGVSEAYTTSYNRDQGIERIKLNAPQALIY